VRAWALISSETNAVVDWFATPGEAAEALGNVVLDEPDLASKVYVAVFEVDASGIELAD
jgi:hypothetical protein